MHMKGTPQNMQDAPEYDNVVDEIMSFFNERLEFCAKHNISNDRITIDPGIGFGKTLEHNLMILKKIKSFQSLGCPVMIGTSRKSFIGKISNEGDPKMRLGGSLASALYGLKNEVQVFRVHDVRETKQAFDVHKAISGAL